jgi:hypothetical protein
MTRKAKAQIPVHTASDRHMAFAREFLANGGKASAALLAIEPDANPKTLHNRASSLLRTDGVSLALAQLRATEDVTSIITFSGVLKRLVTIADGKKTRPADKIKALTEVARLMGFGATPKVEVSGPNGGPIQSVSMTIDPDTAQAITLHLLGVGAHVEAEGEDIT